MPIDLGQHEDLQAMKCPTFYSVSIYALSIATGYAALMTSSAAQPNSVGSNNPTNRYGQGLGRLLTTEVERAKIDDLRFNVAPPPKPMQEAGPPQLHIDGITQRPDRPPGQRVTVWIDGRAYLENALPQGLRLVRNASGEVTGVTSQISKGKTEFAKIGDIITRPQTADEAKAETEAKKQ